MARERVLSTLVVLVAAALAAWAIHADEAWFMTHWTRHQCFLARSDESLALGARVVAAALSLLLLLAEGPLSRVSVASYLRIALAVVLALGASEIYLRSARPRPAARSPLPHVAPSERQSTDFAIGGRTVHYALDEHGYRVANETASVDLSAPSIVMSGESVAFGFGLEYEETIGARLAKRTGLEDVNVAVSGFSNASTLKHLEEELPKLAHPAAVVCFVIHTWLDRNTDRRDWHVVWDDGRAMSLLPPEPETGSPLIALLEGVFRYHDDHRLEVGRQLLAQTAELIRSRNATPLFVLSQCGARCRSTDFVVTELTRDLDAPWISLDTPENENLPGDGHPGPDATARYVDAIERALRLHGALP